MPKTVAKNASVSQVAGKTLAELTAGKLEILKFGYDFEELQKGEAIPEDEKLDDDEIMSVVNAKRNAKARSKAQQAILDENNVEVPSMSVKTPEGALANIIRSLIAQGRSREEAETAAKTLLGM